MCVRILYSYRRVAKAYGTGIFMRVVASARLAHTHVHRRCATAQDDQTWRCRCCPTGRSVCDAAIIIHKVKATAAHSPLRVRGSIVDKWAVAVADLVSERGHGRARALALRVKMRVGAPRP